MADDELQEERIFTIPLRKVKEAPRTKRAPLAIKVITNYVVRHMKPELDGERILDGHKALHASGDDKRIYIGEDVNLKIWERGRERPPSKIRVKAMKLEDGLVEVSLPDE